MTYDQAKAYLASCTAFSVTDIEKGKRTLGLATIKEILTHLDKPHHNLSFIHVAGTNGKGSTVAFLHEILVAQGYKTGVFTSPYLYEYPEMMKVNHTCISKEQFAMYCHQIQEICVQHQIAPSEYEVLFAIALLYFKNEQCDYVILETCLGGLNDVTNCIPFCKMALFTPIGYDHTQILGNTLTSIATHKAGILKEKCQAISTHQAQEVVTVLQKQAKITHSMLSFTNRATNIQYTSTQTTFDYKDFKHLTIGLKGKFQVENAVLAIEAACQLGISDESIYKGLAQARWMARFEWIRENPPLILDGSHNLQGVNSLVESLQTYLPNTKIVFVVGVLKDKNYKDMMLRVKPLAKEFLCVDIDNPRALAKEDLCAYLSSIGCKARTIEDLDELLQYNQPVCVFGSLYYIGHVRKKLG